MASGRAILLLLLITVSVSVAQRRKNKKAYQEPIHNSLVPPIALPFFPFGEQPAASKPSRQFRPINIHYAPVSGGGGHGGGGHAHHAPAEEHHHHYYDDHGHPVDHHHHGDEHHHHHHQGHKGVLLEAKWTIPKLIHPTSLRRNLETMGNRMAITFPLLLLLLATLLLQSAVDGGLRERRFRKGKGMVDQFRPVNIYYAAVPLAPPPPPPPVQHHHHYHPVKHYPVWQTYEHHEEAFLG
ncbi:hypothetical protein pipiens_002212 [Culex pipiens pipiens]|uniref:Uncharacterized protein n=1 Tax=Culex pipiens pipiens TaxID=38569 RepID=A0ABD1DM40_CULPP